MLKVLYCLAGVSNLAHFEKCIKRQRFCIEDVAQNPLQSVSRINRLLQGGCEHFSHPQDNFRQVGYNEIIICYECAKKSPFIFE